MDFISRITNSLNKGIGIFSSPSTNKAQNKEKTGSLFAKKVEENLDTFTKKVSGTIEHAKETNTEIKAEVKQKAEILRGEIKKTHKSKRQQVKEAIHSAIKTVVKGITSFFSSLFSAISEGVKQGVNEANATYKNVNNNK